MDHKEGGTGIYVLLKRKLVKGLQRVISHNKMEYIKYHNHLTFWKQAEAKIMKTNKHITFFSLQVSSFWKHWLQTGSNGPEHHRPTLPAWSANGYRQMGFPQSANSHKYTS